MFLKKLYVMLKSDKHLTGKVQSRRRKQLMVFKLMEKNVYLLFVAELQLIGRILRKHVFILPMGELSNN